MKGENVIYALVDEIGTPRYVGQTSNLLKDRFKRHLGVKDDKPLAVWLQACPDPSIIPLEVNPADSDEAERRWIRQMRAAGLPLLNIYDGGRRAPTGQRHTDETKRRISEARTGKPLSPEHRRKLSEAHKGVPLSEEHRAAIGRGGKGLKRSPETREKMSLAKSGERNPVSIAARARRAAGEVMPT